MTAGPVRRVQRRAGPSINGKSESAAVAAAWDAHQTGKLSDEDLTKLVRRVFPLSPHGIINPLKRK